jgi:hypothetical protein
MSLDSSSPNDFQLAAMSKLNHLLKENDVAAGNFCLNVGAQRAFWTSFFFNGEEHVLSVYEENINLTQGPNLYECYMPEEFESDETLIEGFAARFKRYLLGGEWKGEDEIWFLDKLKSVLKRALRLG